MGSSTSKGAHITITPTTPAHYMCTYYGGDTCQFLNKWNSYTRVYQSREFPLEGTFEMDKISCLRRALKLSGKKVSHKEWVSFFAWYDEAIKRLRESELWSLNNEQKKLKDELEELKRKIALEKKKGPVAPPVVQGSDSENKGANLTSDIPRTSAPQLPENPSASLPSCSAVEHPQKVKEAEKLRQAIGTQGTSKADVPQKANLTSHIPDATTPQVEESPLASLPSHSASEHPERVGKPEKLRKDRQVGTQQTLKADVPLKCEPCSKMGSNGPVTVQPSWTPSDLYNIVSSLPDIQEEPGKFKEQLRVVFACYKPAWRDTMEMLSIAVPSEVLKCLFEKARWPEEDPGWSGGAGEVSRWGLLEAIPSAYPRKSDWDKIKACKQKEGEDPADFLERFKETYEKYSGFDPESTGLLMGHMFVEGLHCELANHVRQVQVSWELPHLLQVANNFCDKRRRKETNLERRLRSLQLQDLQSRVRGRGQGRIAGRGWGCRDFQAVRTQEYFSVTYDNDY